MHLHRSSKFLLRAVLIFALAGPAPAAADGHLDRFSLKDRRTLATHVIDVWVPEEYRKHPRPMPMLVMLDGGYAFDATVQLAQYLQRDREVQPFIIVGVRHAADFGKPLAAERSRDFTPPVDGNGSITREQTAYYRFLRERLLPRLHHRYQVDPAGRVLWGYSLSGSFAAWLDYHDPTLFDHYILASANLMEFGILQKLFAGQIFSTKKGTLSKVFISYDAREIPDPGIVEQGRKLLANGAMFPGHEFRLSITQGETHASSWFVSLPASLRFIFSGAP